MELLLEKSRKKIQSVPFRFKRYLFNRINYKQRLIGISGGRGTGKTTLLLQIGAHLKKELVLYVALDDLFFTENTLYSLAEQFSKTGGELLLLDEVHKYPNWSREIKLLYDDFPELQIIFTSSSILDIYRGESDLSRRVTSYILQEMSFREYLELQYDISFQAYTLDEIVQQHEQISFEMIQQFKPLKYFPDYLKHGNYPYYEGDEDEYYQKILNTVNLVLDIDLPAIQHIEYENIAKIKRLLYVLSTNVPFTPNISKLSDKVMLNRNALVQAIYLLDKAEMLHTLFKQSRSISTLNKPDKIWLHNPNLIYAISNKAPDIGNLRETFLLSQLRLDHQIFLPLKGDFLADDQYFFEVGGKNKTMKQIQGVPNAYLVKDNIESGIFRTIPLWLFGFLY